MHIKKFTGATLKDAMRAVKAGLGENALILSTKRAGQGLYEVVAAVDFDLSRPLDVNVGAAAAGYGARAEEPRPAARKTPAAPAAPAAGDMSPAVKNELKELRELKDFFWDVIARGTDGVAGIYAKLQDGLVENGVDRRLAKKIIANVMKGAEKTKASDAAYLKAYMKDRIAQKISVTDPLTGKGIHAFIGSSGVGKTTTIAKLAAIHALKRKRKVALLTMDTYRIAAAEQLKVYGRIIGAPVEVARSANDLASLIDEFQDRDLILIDTAGRGPGNRAHMEELRAVAAINPAIRFNLVLNTQVRDDGLYECVRGFSAVPVSSLTFTRLDECGGVYGAILNTALLAKKPVAYLTNGQRVPEDIETATKEKLLNLFMPN